MSSKAPKNAGELPLELCQQLPFCLVVLAIGEFVPGYEASAWYGIGAPRGTPADIIDKLNKEVNVALADPKMRARLADLGGTPLPGSPAQFGKLIVDETEKWGKVIKFAGIKPQ
jgi:tripartite-type tricarboxylate transporter receptor subunit TctC